MTKKVGTQITDLKIIELNCYIFDLMAVTYIPFYNTQ